jgi:hypothetical protein
LARNLDFLAAILGGDKKLDHKVIYLVGERQFYYLDPRDQMFKPSSPEKLGNLLRAYVIREGFDLGLRNDVIDQETQRQTSGWKGLRTRGVESEG